LNNLKTIITASVCAAFFNLQVRAADQEADTNIAQTCFECHGQEGISNNPDIPSLAAQQPDYMIHQLKSFSAGNRNNPLMNKIAAGLSDDDIVKVTAYFASRQPRSAGGNPVLASAGETDVETCFECHGAKAQGHRYTPRLAGQQPQYLVTQLKKFRDESRAGGVMNLVADDLSDENMEVVAAYLGSFQSDEDALTP